MNYTTYNGDDFNTYNGDDFIEKIFDLTEYGVNYHIRQHLASGWYMHYEGVTIVILRKKIEEAHQ